MGDDEPSEAEGFGDLADPAREKVDGIEKVSDSAIQSAAQNVVEAAVKARNQELRVEYGSGIEDGQGDFIDGYGTSNSDYQWITAHFERFYDRPLGAGPTMAGNLKAAKTKLDNGKTTVFIDAKDAVNHWAGDARDHFKDNFLNPFPNAINNQNAILDDMRAGLYIYEGIQRKSRENAKAIADATVKGLDAMFGCSMSSPEAKLTYTMVGVAAWIAGTVASGGTGLVLGLTLVGAGSFAGGGIAAYEPEEQEVTGDTVKGVLDNMIEKLNKLETDMRKEEDALATSLDNSLSAVMDHLGSSSPKDKATVLPNEPTDDGVGNVTDGKPPSEDDFRPRD